MAASNETDNQVQLLRAKQAELKALKERLSASAADTPPASAPAAAPAEPSKVLEAFMFSPLFLVAWAFGYLSEWNLFACLSLMGIPLLTAPLVEAGKKSTVVPAVLHALMVPKTVLIVPLGLVYVFRDENDLVFAATLIGVYATLVLAQMVGRRYKLLPP